MDDYLENLIEDDDICYEEEVWKVDASELAQIQARDEIKGGVVVAVTNDAGQLLLIENEWMDGYGFPGGGVELDESWVDAAVRETREETGVAITLIRPWRVLHVEFVCEGKQYESDYTVFYLAAPVDDGIIGDNLGINDEGIEDAAWFDSPPEELSQPDLVKSVFNDLLTEM